MRPSLCIVCIAGLSYGALSAVTAVSGRDAWAVGYYIPPSNSANPPYRTLIFHWNGKSWR
jgi:hypothetical protein